MIAGGWACHSEEKFHAQYPAAGHSVARHGPHIPDGPGEMLEERVTTGLSADVALHGHKKPDGSTVWLWERVASPSDRSSRFLSFRDWLDAHDSAYLALKQQFAEQGIHQHHGPIVGKADKKYPIAAGYLRFRDIDDPSRTITRPLGEAYEAIEDGSQHPKNFLRPDGSEFIKDVYPNTIRVPREEVTHVYATMGWTGHEWILINLYPAKLPSSSTAVELIKRPNPGHDTI